MSAKVVFEILTWAEYFLSGGRMPRPADADANSPELVKMVSRYETQIEKLESDMRNLDLHRAALEGECKELSEKYHKVKETNVYLADRLVNRESEIAKILTERNGLYEKLKSLPEHHHKEGALSTDAEHREPSSTSPVTRESRALEIDCPYCPSKAGEYCRIAGNNGPLEGFMHTARVFAPRA